MDYHLDVYFQEEWYDHRLAHNASAPILVRDLTVFKMMWHPDVYFANARSAAFQVSSHFTCFHLCFDLWLQKMWEKKTENKFAFSISTLRALLWRMRVLITCKSYFLFQDITDDNFLVWVYPNGRVWYDARISIVSGKKLYSNSYSKSHVFRSAPAIWIFGSIHWTRRNVHFGYSHMLTQWQFFVFSGQKKRTFRQSTVIQTSPCRICR